ncbi:hypothetical protein LIER_38579 [Lithospermum erythrorhizon]|uniref:Uncharacterized protein n=1 Tax=Lithospermum erythrorhizon TaxID=34254 RepID=A0AAV3Q6G3_LITER
MSCALVDSCLKVFGSILCRMYCRSHSIPFTGFSWRCLEPVSSIILNVLLVLKKQVRNSFSSCAQLSMESDSSFVYHLNAFPFSERTNCLTI